MHSRLIAGIGVLFLAWGLPVALSASDEKAALAHEQQQAEPASQPGQVVPAPEQPQDASSGAQQGQTPQGQKQGSPTPATPEKAAPPKPDSPQGPPPGRPPWQRPPGSRQGPPPGRGPGPRPPGAQQGQRGAPQGAPGTLPWQAGRPERRHFDPLLFALVDKSPQEQERILQANRHFRRLPPEEQQRLRRHLRHIQQMTAEQREQLRERAQVFYALPQDARDTIRNELFPAWQQFPPERRTAMMAELRNLRAMPPSARNERYCQRAFTKQFSPREQGMLKRLLAVTSTAPPPALK